MAVGQQLTLPLAPRRQRPRELPPIERLQALLRRRGIDPEWRLCPGRPRGWILPMVGLDAGERHRTEPRGPWTGLPTQGCWEVLCAWHINAAHECPEDRYAYREPRDDVWHGRDAARPNVAGKAPAALADGRP